MSSAAPPSPIRIHIPPSLAHLTIPLSTYLQKNPAFSNVAVGACIFTPTIEHQSSSSPPRLLLVQRAATERGFPNLWEVPGGSAEIDDPTVLHSVAREVFEETGLRLTRFVRAVGAGVQFTTGGTDTWMKLSFEIEVQEDVRSTVAGTADGKCLSDAAFDDVMTEETVGNATVKLDPAEHQAFRWLTEEELKHWGPGNIVTEEQRQMMLQAFEGHMKAIGHQTITTSQTPRLESAVCRGSLDPV